MYARDDATRGEREIRCSRKVNAMSPSHKGQAWHVLRGYRYQLLQSLDAWIGLRPGDVLWLETEEDFSVASATGAVDTQVKSSAAAAGPRPHSLQSEGCVPHWAGIGCDLIKAVTRGLTSLSLQRVGPRKSAD